MPEAGQPGAVARGAVGPAEAARAGPQRQVRGRGRTWVRGSALFVLAVVALWFCYLQIARTQRAESDGASIALQGWDTLHGNLLLHGWTVPDVLFYTVETPEFLVVEAIRGLNADALHVVAALNYALLVVLAAMLARGRTTGREAVVRMLVATGIMLAPEPGAGVFIVLFQPDHLATQIPVLVSWLVLEWMPRRWYTPVVIGMLLTWTGIGDQVVLFTGVIPLIVVFGVRAVLAWRRVMPIRDMPRLAWRPAALRTAWFELSLVAAALGSAVLAEAVVKLIHALGGYTMLPLPTGASPIGQLPRHIRLTTDGILGVFGANFQGPPTGWDLVFAVLHLMSVALVIWAVLLALLRFFRCDDVISQILTAGIVVNLAAYVFSVRATVYWSVREIVGILPLGAVLAGRVLGRRLLADARPVARFHRVLASALGVVLAGYLAAFGYAMTKPPVPAVGQDLAGWLKAHGLTYGLGHYGLANVTTIASGAAVAVRPVVTEHARMAAGPHEYNTSWYDPRTHEATFVVLLAKPAALDPMTRAQALTAFGPPTHEYRYREYLVMTWDKNLLSDLAPPAPS
ncbi:MAG TPA: hypothetical protein VFW50_39210 [Streptosporangiaceae bacterium]|nr:hypothetical protein [Streptosporangiaceae bacterium]